MDLDNLTCSPFLIPIITVAGFLFFAILNKVTEKWDYKKATLFGVFLVAFFMFRNPIVEFVFFGMAKLAGLCK